MCVCVCEGCLIVGDNIILSLRHSLCLYSACQYSTMDDWLSWRRKKTLRAVDRSYHSVDDKPEVQVNFPGIVDYYFSREETSKELIKHSGGNFEN